MPAIDLGTTYSRRRPANASAFPAVQMVNLVLEKTVTNQIDQKSWLARPGLLNKYQTDGALRGLCDTPIGFLAAHTGFFYVSGTAMHFQGFTGSPPSFIGAVAGVDFVTFASTPNAMLVCGGDTAYRYDGTFTTIAMPSGEPIAWVTYTAGYFLLGVRDSQHIFFMTPGAASPAALDFFSAEAQGDNQVRGVVLGDQLVIFSDYHTEFWQASGDINLPFSRVVGQLYSKGLAAIQACATLDNSIYFVGSDRCIYRADTQPVNVGDPTIGEALREADLSSIVCWSFVMDNHAYLIVTLGTGDLGTFVFDVSMGSWSKWTSFNGIAVNRAWACLTGFQFADGMVLAGGQYADTIYDVSAAYGDDDGTAIGCFLAGGYPIIGAPVRCDNVTLIMDAGAAPDPVTVTMSYSDDQGETQVSADPIVIQPGDTFGNPSWYMLGLMRQPLRVFYFECDNAGPFRISTARLNESFKL